MVKVVGDYIGNERKPFLVMDVEALFLLPFAVSFLSLSFELCLAILLFIFLLLESLLWAWKKGVLKWV